MSRSVEKSTTTVAKSSPLAKNRKYSAHQCRLQAGGSSHSRGSWCQGVTYGRPGAAGWQVAASPALRGSVAALVIST
ncbi:MAG: hypothetical protein OEZ08_15230, partial [Betaproteobacteria bacterium]|nr:hypothetical protein [Betaproteobacteria bacterium]